MAEGILDRLGYKVLGKTDSVGALQTFGKDPSAFDLVITDHTMPQMTGAILAQKLKEIRPDIPIILCTGYSETISKEKAESMPIDGFVVKPLSRNGDDRTAYFRSMVEKKDIAQILYLPLFAEQGGDVVGVTVIDAIREREFDDDEIMFCSEVAELVSLLIGQERAILQHFRDEIINKLVPLSCFAKRLRENMETTLGYIEIIHKEAEEIDKILPKSLEKIL